MLILGIIIGVLLWQLILFTIGILWAKDIIDIDDNIYMTIAIGIANLFLPKQ